MPIKRYGTSCAERQDGCFVKYEDYAALESALRRIASIDNKMVGGDWDEIEEARAIARAALGEAA